MTDHDRVAARALYLLPDDAVATATNSLGAHLSERRRILSFPARGGARWILIDERKPSYRDRLGRVPLAPQVARLRATGHWRLVFSRDGILIFRRG